MAYTVQQLIDAALRDIGALASGESPNAQESADALLALNQLLMSWNAQALPIFKVTRTAITLNGAASYALGTRPVKIKAASCVVSSSLNVPLNIATAAEWAAYAERGSGDFGDQLFYEDGYPLGKIHIAPRATGTLELITDKAIEGGVIGQRESFAVNGAASYTIGVGGTFATERPVKIKGASILAGGSRAKDVAILSAEGWAQWEKRGVEGSFVRALFCDYGFPTATVYVGPKGSGSLELFTLERLAAFSGLAQDISTLLPDGYERALRAGLAFELGPEYGRQVDKDLVEDAKMSIFGLNKNILGEATPAIAEVPPLQPPAPPNAKAAE
jgi:hypothetical protein